ncbi:MAG: thymidine phosphorylase [Rhodobacteraceae bacterium]|nr:thymidine phosphorylase [Paracoccaceae bacterium]
MIARDVIATLRNGDRPKDDDIAAFAAGLADGSVTDAQAGAFAMAVCLNGLGDAGRVALTRAMRDSGEVLHWDMPGPVLDKHSTGGVGDCVSLLLAPALAALGAYVPMISGRGLGHTGGTLDKLEAIPGLTTEQPEDAFRRIVASAGAAIVAASGDIAPADRRLYAVRDVTSTVDSVDLITASILSKKLAAGLEALVLDVKVGSGAFMATTQDATELADALVGTANGAGCATAALITDMNQPLAPAVGNALEVIEVMEALVDGDTDSGLSQITCELGGTVLKLAGLASDSAEGAGMVAGAIASGAALERFGAMITAMGGPADFTDRWRDRLPAAPVVIDLPAPATGYVAAMDARMMGEVVVRLGGGRLVQGQTIDASVGLTGIRALGDEVDAREPLLQIHASSREAGEAAATALANAIRISDTLPDLPPLVHLRLP